MVELYSIINFVLTIISFAILARLVLSWAVVLGWHPPAGMSTVVRVLFELTEPLLAPIRSLLSRLLPIPLDFSPMIAIFLIQFLQSLLRQAMFG